MDKNMTLGQFLKAHRLGEEESQKDFAEFLGISKQRLCDIEHDRFNISIKLAKSLAQRLDLPAEWVVKLALEKQLKDEKINLKVG
ncbi:MAG: helix-turn-helix transcriptional regulator [Bdellovibrionales bacterium]|nr:helix-turn-helix transcriptional regulator [Bdellovibrionales bacterium]MCB0415855.1 helix-turn-helix transcriptional regulator [Bdellovibrionales bacterium]